MYLYEMYLKFGFQMLKDQNLSFHVNLSTLLEENISFIYGKK